MKIMFLAAASNIHTVRWVNALQKKGLEVYLISLKNQENTKQNLNKKIKVYYLPFSGIKGYYLNLFFLNKLFKKINPDIVNIHYASGYGTLGRFLKTDKKLLNVWGSDVYNFPYQSKFKKKLLVKNLNAYKFIASTSFCMAEQTRKFLKKDMEIFITPFGVDTNVFKSLKKENTGKITIGIVKTLQENYGIKYLIEAFYLLCQKYKKENLEIYEKLELEIYGSGELENLLKKLAKNLQLEEKIKFCGYIENSKLPKIINKFTIFCVPSIEESFGVAAVEAMACEIPVIVSDADGLKEIVMNEKDGYIVPKKDSKILAEKIEKIILNEELGKKMGKKGREKVLKLYDWDENVDRMIEIYKKIAKNLI